ncbi:MAG: hypothetical protein AAFX08_09810 [Pseudomonadota bacterium]
MPNGLKRALAGGENAGRNASEDAWRNEDSWRDDGPPPSGDAIGFSKAHRTALRDLEGALEARLKALEAGLAASLARSEVLQTDLASRMAAISSTLMRIDASVAAQSRALDLFANFEGLRDPDSDDEDALAIKLRKVL